MNPARLASILFLLALGGYCGFSLLKTFRPPGFPTFRAAYAIGGLACLAGVAVKLGQARTSTERGRRDDPNER